MAMGACKPVWKGTRWLSERQLSPIAVVGCNRRSVQCWKIWHKVSVRETSFQRGVHRAQTTLGFLQGCQMPMSMQLNPSSYLKPRWNATAANICIALYRETIRLNLRFIHISINNVVHRISGVYRYMFSWWGLDRFIKTISETVNFMVPAKHKLNQTFLKTPLNSSYANKSWGNFAMAIELKLTLPFYPNWTVMSRDKD